MPRQKIARHQQWSEVCPEILLDYLKSDKASKDKSGWGVSIDTPNYSHYSQWMNLYACGPDMTYSECEQKITEMFQPSK